MAGRTHVLRGSCVFAKVCSAEERSVEFSVYCASFVYCILSLEFGAWFRLMIEYSGFPADHSITCDLCDLLYFAGSVLLGRGERVFYLLRLMRMW